MRICRVGNLQIGEAKPLAIIAGPCLLESPELGRQIGKHVRTLCRDLPREPFQNQLQPGQPLRNLLRPHGVRGENYLVETSTRDRMV